MFGKLFGSKQLLGGELEAVTADRAFRDSVLLMKLLEAEGASPGAVGLLVAASSKWRHAEDARIRATGLNLLRFLFKAMHVLYSKPLLDEVLELFTSSQSLAARLAALDTLGAMSASPNPVQLLSPTELKQLTDFRSRLMSEMNVAQREYVSTGVRADLAIELANKPPGEAIASAIERMGHVGA